ncbi:MAG: hypothetical protein NZM38_02800 [Cytophagales bacterium]|nr:hypothetical protein [Cytophagales bacterium]MDW8383682.1 hypothetical protein [Flammeovirgaceae bacterium]
MKKYRFFFLMLAASACSSGSQETTQQQAQTSSPTVTAFFSKFENAESGKSYDYDWFFGFTQNKAGKEISAEECSKFLEGNQIINHPFDGNPTKKITCNKTYYRVANVPGRPDITTIIFSDGEKETYLCTYDTTGKFISGIVLQYYTTEKEIEIFRNGGLADGGTKIILKDAKPNTNFPPMIVYEITLDGKIQQAQ